MTTPIFASLARIADFPDRAFEIDWRDQSEWATGDYVAATVVGTETALYQIEDCEGGMVRVRAGTRVIGALGERAATLEGVGSWRDVVDGRMHALTSAGLFGAFTSLSQFLPAPLALDYDGHVTRKGQVVRMRDFAMQGQGAEYAVPTILLVGTSMSAGKTITGKLVCRLLAEGGFRVLGTKLTGAGRYRDIFAFREAGAFEVYDFVDGGLPSTVVSEDVFRAAIRPVLRHIATRGAEFVVAEAGASPLEPYNGAAAIDELRGHIVCTILCASDPYAVVGVMDAFGLKPDLVCGPATNTSAAIELVRKLSGVRGINVVDPRAEGAFRDFLEDSLGISVGC